MRPHCMIAFLILSLTTYFRLQFTRGEEHRLQDSICERKNRRILHQPLFPASSAPPPQSELSPPPPPESPKSPDQDQPFFHELPNGSTPDPAQQSPQAPASGTTVGNPVVKQPSKPAKKVAIAISVGMVTLGMLSALAFYLYKHRVKHRDVSQKLVGGNSQRINEESGVGPSTFLYVGTVEPSTTRSVTDTNVVNISPSQKLNSIKRTDQKPYRPSPDLQPLPPLNKPLPHPSINPSPPMSSSDDESHDTTFYSAQASSVSNTSPNSRHCYPSNNSSLVHQARPDHVVPQSKRTSPKSHLSTSSPDTKHAIVPTINQLLPRYPPPPPPPPPPPAASSLESLQQSEEQPSISAQPYISKRPKFAAPPPPLDIGRLQWINNDVLQASKIPVPPPPPMPTSRKLSTVTNTPPGSTLINNNVLQASKIPVPPPPPMPTSRKLSTVTNTPPGSTLIRSQSRSPSPRATPRIKKTSPVKEVNTAVSSSEKQEAEDSEGSKRKLKPLHWDKVRTTSDRATVWDQLNSSSFQLNEDEMESLFGWSSANAVLTEATRKSILPPLEMENRVLDPKKSQNIAILLRALNVTRDEVSEALLDGNPEGLGADLLETLVKMAPTKEEEIKFKDYNGDISKLGTAERFLKAVLDIPFAFKRVEAMLYRANFDTEVNYLRKSFLTIEEASEELKNSRLFLKLLEAVLRTGNRMNVGTNRGDARAFKLDTLLKLVDIKGTDGKTTLLHFVVQEILRLEGAYSDPTNQSMLDKTNFSYKEEDFKRQGLQVVAGLSKELGNVRRAAGMDSDVLSSYVSKLEIGLEKVRLVLQHEKQNTHGKFFESMQTFLDNAQTEINVVKAEERAALSLVKELTEYFHGDSAREEAHPFRIFMIVRDFLSTLDNVCKDVGTMQDRTTIGAARSFRIPVTASLPVLNRYNIQHDRSSDDESMPS